MLRRGESLEGASSYRLDPRRFVLEAYLTAKPAYVSRGDSSPTPEEWSPEKLLSASRRRSESLRPYLNVVPMDSLRPQGLKKVHSPSHQQEGMTMDQDGQAVMFRGPVQGKPPEEG